MTLFRFTSIHCSKKLPTNVTFLPIVAFDTFHLYSKLPEIMSIRAGHDTVIAVDWVDTAVWYTERQTLDEH